MQNKVIQTSNIKSKKEKDLSKNDLALINTLLTTNIELSKHKSHEIYGQYSPSNLSKNNNNNNPSINNNQKKNNTLANTIKKIIQYSGAKKSNNQNMTKNTKSRSKKEYGNLNINDLNAQMNNKNNLSENKNETNKLKKHNLDNILSESDSCQEIDSMEEESLSHGIKSSNVNLKAIPNMKRDFLDVKSKNDLDYKRHLTSGINSTTYNNKNTELIPKKNSKKSLNNNNSNKKNKNKVSGKKKTKKLNINDDNEETDEEIIVNDNEFDNSRFISTDKLKETKFPKLSSNPFIGQNNSSIKNEEYRKSISSKEYNTKWRQTISSHHIKSTTLGTINNTGPNHNSSNLSNTIDYLNINLNNKTDELYKNLLAISKKGDKEKFLEILGQIFSLPKELININFQDKNGNSALHYSCDEGNLKIVEILLKANCETNIKNNEKKTPLHLSSKRGYFDISKKLIENGALLNVFDSENNSPLHYVCMENHVELLKFFLTKFPKADTKNIHGKRPIDLTKNKDIKETLDEYMKKNKNSYHKIKIYETTDLKMENMLEKQKSGDLSSEKKRLNTSSQKSKNSSLSPKSKENKNKYKVKLHEYNTVQNSSNIKKKNTLNPELKRSNYINIENNNEKNNIYVNNSNGKVSPKKGILKNSANSALKKSELNSSEKSKDNVINTTKKIKKENNQNNTNNKKVHVLNSNQTIKMSQLNNKNNSNTLNTNHVINALKKTKTVDQFSTAKPNDHLNQTNIYNSQSSKNNEIIGSKLNNSNYEFANINNSVNNELNRIKISVKSKNEKVKLNKSKTKEDSNDHNKINSENKSKIFDNNLKYKKLFLDQVQPSANIINLNKTEENITTSKLIKKSIDKKKSGSKTKKHNKNKNQNIKNSQNNPQSHHQINHINFNLEKSYTSPSPKNCNISKISPNKKRSIEPLENKTNIVDQTLTDNLHVQLNLNSIEEERISPSSFICLAQLGKGSFGEVYLVQKINTKEKFAMKVLRKERIMGQNLLKYAIAERNVLSLSNHPFIVKLNFAFQTSTKLFLILEYCPNGDLAKHLLFEKRFSEERAKFYICEVLLALENLHQRDIIFRDLKPDNVVLDSEGHCKLTDFGLSKEGINENQITNSFCGSIAYLAPEMLKKQGHGKAVDWYLLGVLLYEMLVGITPFFTNRKEDIFHNIEFGELKIPEFIREDTASLLRGLLQKDPWKRLGGGIKDAMEIKQHPYFKDVNWDDVYNKRIRPPPVNVFTRNIMHVYQRPRLFANDDNLSICSDRPNPNMLPGWSFINNEEA